MTLAGVRRLALSFFAGAERIFVAVEEINADDSEAPFLRRERDVRMIVKSTSANAIKTANTIGRMRGVVQLGRILRDANGFLSLDSLERLLRMSVKNILRIDVRVIKKSIGGFGFLPSVASFIDAGGRVSGQRGEQRFGSIIESLIAELNVLKFVFNARRFHAFISKIHREK